MSILAAILTALAIVATQALHGGLFVPAFSIPGAALLVGAALFGVVAISFNRAAGSPGALAIGLVFLGYVIWRGGHAQDQYLARLELGLALGAGLAFAIGCAALTTTPSRFTLLGIIIAAAAVQAVLGFFQFAHGGLAAPLGWMALDLRGVYETRFATRAHGLFLNPNQFAWLEGWAALFCISLAAWGRVTVIVRLVLVYLALMFIVADVLSGSRGGLASLIAGFATFGLLSVVGAFTMMRRGRGFALAGALVLMGLCAGVGAFMYSSNWMTQGRMESLSQEGFRSLALEHARRQFETAPLLGGGPGVFVHAARLYRTGDQSGDAIFAHDDWVQMAVEYGSVGFALALLALLILVGGGIRKFFKAIGRRALSHDRPQSNSAAILIGAISATVAFGIHSLTDFNMHVPANALLAGVTLGLLAGAGGQMKERWRFQDGILRVFGGMTTAILSVALALYLWKYANGDHQNLLAANALAEGKVDVTLDHTAQGLRTSPRDAGLLANQGRALFAYESSLQFQGKAETSDDWARDITAEPDPAQADTTDSDANETDESSDSGDETDVVTLTPAEREKYYQGSVDAFSKAIEAQPMERRLKIELANALVETGNPQEAERLFITAIRQDPAHGYAYGAYGDFLYEADRVNRALRVYELGSMLPGGTYCGEKAQDIREELAPLAPDETDAESAPNEGTSGQ